MRVFLDTNVLVSAFMTRGLSADVFRLVLQQHELLVGEVILAEFRRVLQERMRVPEEAVAMAEELLREQTVVAKPSSVAPVGLRDPDDEWVLASAVEANADVLITGDQNLLCLGEEAPLPIVDPRGFWELVTRP